MSSSEIKLKTSTTCWTIFWSWSSRPNNLFGASTFLKVAKRTVFDGGKSDCCCPGRRRTWGNGGECEWGDAYFDILYERPEALSTKGVDHYAERCNYHRTSSLSLVKGVIPLETKIPKTMTHSARLTRRAPCGWVWCLTYWGFHK